MLRLWNRSPNTASAKKENEGTRSNNRKPQETATNGGEKENGAAKESELPGGTEFLSEPCNYSAPAASRACVSDTHDSACVKTGKASTATQTAGDPYEWAYEVWRDMGLMGSKKKMMRPTTLLVESRLISDIIGGIEDRVSQQHQEKQEELRKQQEREQSISVLITPRGPTSSNTFSERAHRRMSLPSQSTQKKQQGRKSFANILQQWREKSDDKPNAHFCRPASQDEQRRTSENKFRQDDDSVSQASKSGPISSRGRVRSLLTETSQEGPGRSIRRTRSVSRSRGDFRTAVQQVLESVDAVQSLPRSKSAPFANSMTNQDRQEYEITPAEYEFTRSPVTENGKSRDGARYQRSKSAPRSMDCSTVQRMSGAYRHNSRLFSPSSGRDAKSSQGKTRMTDFMNLTAGDRMINSDDNFSIPSHVEIDDDDHYSVADSKLTDMRTECESLGPSPARTPVDSPWTRNVASKLKHVHQGNGSGSRDGRPWHHDIIINRVGSMSDSRFPEEGECFCSTGVFAGKDDLIDFFLPLMGTGCTCGKYSDGLRNPAEPTSLENILRPWQVNFLAGFGIYRGDEMVKAHHRSGSALATALRQYQKKKGISSYRTKSCAMALEIWAKTCKAFVRSIRKQLTEGTAELKLPNTLYILSSFLERLPVHGNDPNVSSSSSVASGAWSVTHSRRPLTVRPYEAVGLKYVTRSESSDVSEV